MGVILAMQFRVTKEITKDTPSQERSKILSQELEEDIKEREKLQLRVYELRDSLDEALVGPELTMLKEELDRVRRLAGLTEVSGPGVEVTLKDSPNALQPGQSPNAFILHDEDVLSVLNELKAAGATDISINGQRIIFSTEVRCIGPTILLNKNQRLSPPFVIYALGNPETLEGSLKMKEGVVDSLQPYGIQVNVKQVDELIIPAYSGPQIFKYARPADIREGA